jgi:hypothetical protein
MFVLALRPDSDVCSEGLPDIVVERDAVVLVTLAAACHNMAFAFRNGDVADAQIAEFPDAHARMPQQEHDGEIALLPTTVLSNMRLAVGVLTGL